MPYFDRHWQLRWLGAGLAAVAAVLLPLRYLQVATSYDHLHGWDMRPDIAFAVVSCPTLLGVALLLARSARRARARLQWRLEMAHASVHPSQRRASPSMVSDPTAPKNSVITVQRVGILDRVVGWMMAPIFLASGLVTVLVFALGVQFLINPTAQAFARASTPAFVYLLFVPVMAFAVWLEGTVASDAWASPPRFELDELGISRIPRGSERLTIRWQDARFLEAVMRYRPEGRSISRQDYYLLYGSDSVMRIDPKRSYSREAPQLLALIKEHTGLVPHQFDQPSGRLRILRRSHAPHIER
jgi:hypothetical protein